MWARSPPRAALRRSTCPAATRRACGACRRVGRRLVCELHLCGAAVGVPDRCGGAGHGLSAGSDGASRASLGRGRGAGPAAARWCSRCCPAQPDELLHPLRQSWANPATLDADELVDTATGLKAIEMLAAVAVHLDASDFTMDPIKASEVLADASPRAVGDAAGLRLCQLRHGWFPSQPAAVCRHSAARSPRLGAGGHRHCGLRLFAPQRRSDGLCLLGGIRPGAVRALRHVRRPAGPCRGLGG